MSSLVMRVKRAAGVRGGTRCGFFLPPPFVLDKPMPALLPV
jgi:hypothetical protein